MRVFEKTRMNRPISIGRTSAIHRANVRHPPDKCPLPAGRVSTIYRTAAGHPSDENRSSAKAIFSARYYARLSIAKILFFLLFFSLLYSSLLYSTGFHWLFPPCWRAFQRFVHSSFQPPFFRVVFIAYSPLFSPLFSRFFPVLFHAFFHACQRLIHPLFFHSGYPFGRT